MRPLKLTNRANIFAYLKIFYFVETISIKIRNEIVFVSMKYREERERERRSDKDASRE